MHGAMWGDGVRGAGGLTGVATSGPGRPLFVCGPQAATRAHARHGHGRPPPRALPGCHDATSGVGSRSQARETGHEREEHGGREEQISSQQQQRDRREDRRRSNMKKKSSSGTNTKKRSETKRTRKRRAATAAAAVPRCRARRARSRGAPGRPAAQPSRSLVQG